MNCRLCGHADIECLGAIPDSDCFAGRILPTAIPGGRLWRCRECHSMFRHPIQRAGAYIELYEDGVTDQWAADADRLDLEIIRRLVVGRPRPASVLDVGCGTGGFLASLPPHIARFGVEPSPAACAAASGLGVAIVGRTMEEVSAGKRFDVITLIDVVEHVADPLLLLDRTLQHLTPGGCVIVSTGDPGARPWRHLFRSRFWYSSYPEHISFPSLKLLRSWQERHRLRPLAAVQTRYRATSQRRAWAYFASQVAYYLSPTLWNVCWRGVDRLAHRTGRRYFSPAGPGIFVDHQVVAASSAPSAASSAS